MAIRSGTFPRVPLNLVRALSRAGDEELRHPEFCAQSLSVEHVHALHDDGDVVNDLANGRAILEPGLVAGDPFEHASVYHQTQLHEQDVVTAPSADRARSLQSTRVGEHAFHHFFVFVFFFFSFVMMMMTMVVVVLFGRGVNMRVAFHPFAVLPVPHLFVFGFGFCDCNAKSAAAAAAAVVVVVFVVRDKSRCSSSCTFILLLLLLLLLLFLFFIGHCRERFNLRLCHFKTQTTWKLNVT